MLFYSTELLTQVPIAVWLPANRAKKLYRKRVFVLPGKKPTTRRTYVKSLSRHKIAKIITIMGVEPLIPAFPATDSYSYCKTYFRFFTTGI